MRRCPGFTPVAYWSQHQPDRPVPMALGITKYDDDSASYVVNEADYDAALNARDITFGSG
jgi:hypothetical protein